MFAHTAGAREFMPLVSSLPPEAHQRFKTQEMSQDDSDHRQVGTLFGVFAELPAENLMCSKGMKAWWQEVK